MADSLHEHTFEHSTQEENGGLSDSSVFLASLAAVTFFPLIFIPFAVPFRGSIDTVDQVFRVLLLMSTMHVGLTAYFYFEGEYRRHAINHYKYYIALPLIVIFLCGAITMNFPNLGIHYLLVFYHAWLLFHYGRQNYGLLAFTTLATKGKSPNRLEKMALHLAPIGGILAANSVLGAFDQTVFSSLSDEFFTIGAVITGIAILSAATSALQNLITHGSVKRSVCVFGLSLFYLPTFFFDNYTQAVLGYAIAHALQYFVFMVFLASGKPRQSAGRSLMVLVFAMLATWTVIVLTSESAMWGALEGFIVGAAVGLVIWHFILDAGFWKLSVEWQRNSVKTRFGFLFDR
ncbi:MAG: hypothetical protein ABJH52_00015 [Henriciella sp.]